MFDRETVSLWIHTTGEAVIGEYKAKTLEFLPATVTTWEKWKKEHPETLVLDVKKGKKEDENSIYLKIRRRLLYFKRKKAQRDFVKRLYNRSYVRKFYQE